MVNGGEKKRGERDGGLATKSGWKRGVERAKLTGRGGAERNGTLQKEKDAPVTIANACSRTSTRWKVVESGNSLSGRRVERDVT
jgi:hypothetical protein